MATRKNAPSLRLGPPQKKTIAALISTGPQTPEEVVLQSAATADCDRNNLLNFECARVYLNVSRSTLLRYIYGRKVDAIKMDGGWKFRWEALERFVQRRTQKAA